MSSARLCLCVTCGLPASGKTKFCELIEELSTVQTTLHGEWIAVIHMCYDELMPRINYSPELHQNENQSLWKQHRRRIVDCLDDVFKVLTESEAPLSLLASQHGQPGSGIGVEGTTDAEGEEITRLRDCVWRQVAKCLSASVPPATTETGRPKDVGRVLFLIDDNMFYRSMRYCYFQLARKYGVGFCQVCLVCDKEIAMERNSGRTDAIPAETMSSMAAKIELPDASKAPWEKNSILIDAHPPLDHAVLAPVWMLIQEAFASPVPLFQGEDLQAKEESRAECAASVLHQADRALRKGISDVMAKAKGRLSGQERRDLALRLSASKAAILEGVRWGRLVPPPLPRGEESRDEFEAFFRSCLSSAS